MSTKVVSTLGTIPTLTVAGMVFTNIANNTGTAAAGDYIELFGWVQSNANNVAGLVEAKSIPNNGVSATKVYKVPTGLKFRALAIRIQQINSTIIEGALQYADTDIGMLSGTQGTNPVDEGGFPGFQGVPTHIGGGTAGTISESTANLLVPADKYLYFTNWVTGGTCTVRVYGYLE